MDISCIWWHICIFNWTILYCWFEHLTKILDVLNDDGYVMVDWKLTNDEFVQLKLWYDFDCVAWFDKQDIIDNREAEEERYKHIRNAPIF